MNRVILSGNLGADPELKMTQGGTAVLKLRIATNERVKKGEEWVDHTEWHNVTLFGKRAEGLSRFLHKGSKVVVEGKLRTSSYDKEGQKHYRTEVIADDLELGDKKQNGDAPSKSSSKSDTHDGWEPPF